jgi:geranylgeranyl pyrophosphate synthase
MTEFDLEGYLEDRRARVNEALDRALPPVAELDHGRMAEGMRYSVLQGGKRMRPLLVAAACEAAGGTVEQSFPAGCALEFIHAYSLVHDDLPSMDNDLERRGKPTVHVAFGEANAILIGDALLTLAFEVLARGTQGVSRASMADAVVVLARHAGIAGMVGGQAQDLSLGQSIGDLQQLEGVHALKTGGLYAAAGALGGLCAGASREVVESLERYGLAFGIAFQHADDVLDDDQRELRSQALARVDALAEECSQIAAPFGESGSALSAIARWVRSRAHRAASGDRRD